ncbi:MAG: integrase arm-type DNA-binding domain-containing protein [Rubrivivax sp.]
MSTWPNRGGLRRPLRGGPEERENPKTQTANLSIRSTRSDSSQQASTKPGVVHWGPYPAISLSEARTIALVKRAEIAQGKNPIAERLKAKAALAKDWTVRQLIKDYRVNHPGFRGGLLA